MTRAAPGLAAGGPGARPARPAPRPNRLARGRTRLRNGRAATGRPLERAACGPFDPRMRPSRPIAGGYAPPRPSTAGSGPPVRASGR
ncbi:hypothetical protein DIS09_30900 [Burkholderia pseudomallei]|nr:hypothetical protein DIS09_30900 [Burkholderia pseudomallei]